MIDTVAFVDKIRALLRQKEFALARDFVRDNLSGSVNRADWWMRKIRWAEGDRIFLSQDLINCLSTGNYTIGDVLLLIDCAIALDDPKISVFLSKHFKSNVDEISHKKLIRIVEKYFNIEPISSDEAQLAKDMIFVENELFYLYLEENVTRF